jgi:indolepyruvate ferredoxin oxidoreductase alpha subunit
MYPLPVQKIRKLVEAVDEVVVVEEGYPFMEEALRGVMGAAGKTIRGKLDGFLPRTGELNPGVVAAAFGIPVEAPFAPTLDPVPARPPSLCPGCSHVDTFLALNDALAGQAQSAVFSDIGCYTLGFYPPYSAIESCVDMGASVSMALGAARAGFRPVLCAVGDSTFCHGGMTGLLTAAHINAAMTVLILDNGTVAMTGSQETMATGEALDRIVLGLGVHPDHFKVVTPLPAKRKEITDIIRKELEYEGLSVIITRRPCIHLRRKA